MFSVILFIGWKSLKRHQLGYMFPFILLIGWKSLKFSSVHLHVIHFSHMQTFVKWVFKYICMFELNFFFFFLVF